MRIRFALGMIMNSIDVILHPTDFSEDSDQAFQLACNMARDQYVSLVVVHVLPPDGVPLITSDVDVSHDNSPQVEACRKQFCRMRAMGPDIPITFRIVRGHPVNAILNVALEEGAGLIVIASHRHSQFHLQLHGSVAEGLLRQTPCPVVVLRQPTGSMARRATKAIGAS